MSYHELVNRSFNVETLKVAEKKILTIQSGDILIEICDNCVTGCEYCYGKDRFLPKGSFLDFKTIKRRLDWIQKFVDIKDITVLGGEAILSPVLIQVIKEIQKRGIHPTIITSGVYNPNNPEHQRNVEFMLEEYGMGDISIEMSYHYGHNEKFYEQLLSKIRGLMLKRHENLLKKSPDDLDKRKYLYSTITLDRKLISNSEKHFRIYEHIVKMMDRNLEAKVDNEGKPTTLRELIDENYQKLKRHFAINGQSKYFSWQMTFALSLGESKFVYGFRFRGVDEITYSIDSSGKLTRHIVQPAGGDDNPIKCPGMSSSIDEDGDVSLQSAVIKTNGDVFYTMPVCIGVNHGLVNIDDPRSQSVGFVRESIRGRLMQIKRNITLSNRISAFEGRPGRCKDAKVCGGCPLDKACGICTVQKPPEVKLIDPTTL